jgi:hypothetical protein
MKYKPKQPKRQEEPSGEVKLAVRLLPDLDEALRKRTRRRGDLSRMVAEAIDNFTLVDTDRQVPDMRGRLADIQQTSLSVPFKTRQALRSVAHAAEVTENALVNAAVREWLTRSK